MVPPLDWEPLTLHFANVHFDFSGLRAYAWGYSSLSGHGGQLRWKRFLSLSARQGYDGHL